MYKFRNILKLILNLYLDFDLDFYHKCLIKYIEYGICKIYDPYNLHKSLNNN